MNKVRVPIDVDYLLQQMIQGHKIPSFEVSRGLPFDGEYYVCMVEFDIDSQLITLIVEGDNLPEVKHGELIPKWNIELQSVIDDAPVV